MARRFCPRLPGSDGCGSGQRESACNALAVDTAYIELLASRYKNAWEMSEEALALSRAVGDGYMFMVGHYYAGLALLHLGEWGKLRQIAEESKRAFESNDASLPLRLHYQILMAWLYVEAGDHAGAKGIVRKRCLRRRRVVLIYLGSLLGYPWTSATGLKDYAGAAQCFEIFFQAKKNEVLPVFSNYFFPACLGACRNLANTGRIRTGHVITLNNCKTGRLERRAHLSCAQLLHVRGDCFKRSAA